MRIRVQSEDRQRLFDLIRDNNIGTHDIARLCRVSVRTVTDWKSGKYTVHANAFDSLLLMARIEKTGIRFTVLDDWWNTAKAARKGVAAQFLKYGQLGTADGRSRGGTVSYMRRKDIPGDIFTPVRIAIPDFSEKLAEFIGILIGDGCVTTYQVSVSTNSVDDREYAIFVARQFRELFGVQVSITKLKNAQCVTVTSSSKELVNLLESLGVHKGHKLRNGLCTPDWVVASERYSKACVRGIFDTDGCVYQEIHRLKSGTYSYPRMAFVSMSKKLRDDIYDTLNRIGLGPRLRNKRSVNLERFTDIQKYFMIVGSSNPKHLTRFRLFGGVA